MLVITLHKQPSKRHFTITLPDGREVVVTLVSVHQGNARIGITAPKDIAVSRGADEEFFVKGEAK